jgi:beta-phosphoglucomutase-like phosphatase (HAD superfamily)
MNMLSTLKAAAVDIDGVLVADTFSPVIREMVDSYGGTYDRDVERHVFSQNRLSAARYLIGRLGLNISEDALIAEYFERRAAWIETHGGGLNPGVEGFLDTLADAGLRMICYGGLSASHFERELGRWTSRFETYVCTNDFRPGVAEITRDVFALAPQKLLFFDDVSLVAEAARELGCAFVGVPSPFSWGFQAGDMVAVGVRHRLGSLAELTPERLRTIDAEAETGFWSAR